MFKKVYILILFCFFFLFSPSLVLAQNKAGIHIGDHFNDFDKAASIVGPGGWVVIMACPGDADKIAAMIASHPEVNIVIRGHYPGISPNETWAKDWAASLGAIPTPNKIYFVPWNEPNQAGSQDWADPAQLDSYINSLFSAFASIRGRVVILSPMLNRTWVGGAGDFDNYVSRLLAIRGNFFSRFDGISMNLYDIADSCGGSPFCSDNPHFNPLLASNLLGQMGAGGKSIYGVESGTAGNNFYWRTDPSSSSPLYAFTNRFLAETRAVMFALPSYDLAGEVGHSWSLFEPADVINILRSAPNGSTTAASPPIASTLSRCPGKQYSFYVSNESECTECGSMISVCKPVEGEEYGEERSKNAPNFSETATYNYLDPDCLIANFDGKIDLEDFQIPFANQLNKYFLGPYVDTLKARVEKTEVDYFKDNGVFEKLAPKEFQDLLKLRFIEETRALGEDSRYYNFRIEGRTLDNIASRFNSISEKLKDGRTLSRDDLFFLDKVWPQVPLFGNEEGDGEVVFYGSGVDGNITRLKTSVPEVYRLDKVTKTLANMMGVSGIDDPISAIRYPHVPLPQGTDCPETPNVPPNVSDKETKLGLGDEICTDDSIQQQENPFEASRIFVNDAGNICKNVGGCDPALGDIQNRCCGAGGKCDWTGTGWTCKQCGENDSCWSPNRGTVDRCCIPDDSIHTKTFDVYLNTVNRVPFLKRIIDSTVGKAGLFRIFTPQGPIQEIDTSFREVAGESDANLEIDINEPISFNGISFNVGRISSPLRLLFYKLGTFINVKYFVAGKLLWPFNPYTDFTSPTGPGTLDYTIDFRNSNLVISEETKQRIIAEVKSYWPNSLIEQEWDRVYNWARSYGWNPAFVITLWIEESGANGVSGAWGLGCGVYAGVGKDIQSQLDCLGRVGYANGTFAEFMCMYSEGEHEPCTFTLNPNFPRNIKIWYDRFTI